MVTKRHIGLALLVTGLAAIAGILAVDHIGVGEFGGIGPVQRLALAAGGLVAAVGLGLIPLGDRPA